MRVIFSVMRTSLASALPARTAFSPASRLPGGRPGSARVLVPAGYVTYPASPPWKYVAEARMEDAAAGAAASSPTHVLA
ncbi:hypothetical protein SMICM304S_07150 [Streptomyces microflavus]